MHKIVIMDGEGNGVLLNLTNKELKQLSDLDNAEFVMGIMPAQDANLVTKRREVREKYNNKIEELLERGTKENSHIDIYTFKNS